jgi:carboxypeptidase PM20D1
MKKTASLFGLVCVLLISILFVRTFQFTSDKQRVEPAEEISLDEAQIAHRLSRAITFQTLSHQDPDRFDVASFHAFHAYLNASFPIVHKVLIKEVVNHLSLVYTWQGSDPTLKPILLMAHQDVVPVPPETNKDWEYPPFEGRFAEGYIWGRGTLDVKSGLLGILEAVESLLKQGFQPMRTVVLAFGHDEEVGGTHGARAIAGLLESREIQFEYILDEGGIIAEGIIPFLPAPVALVGIAEKGYVSLELSVKSEGGHSSMPPKHTAIGILSQAITRLEENPFPSNMTYTSELFETIGPKVPFLKRAVLANLWLFGPLVEARLSRSPQLNAGIRTTAAATLFSGGVQDNILPVQATGVVNFRIMPGETVASVIDYVKATIDRPEIRIQPVGYHGDPSPVSDIRSQSYQLLQRTILEVATEEELVVAPYLVVGATDSRYYTKLSANVYRFLLNKLGPNDLKRIHGTNERIRMDHYKKVIAFYYHLLRNSQTLE